MKSEGKVKKEKVLLLLPETFMNNSGNAVMKAVTSKKKAGKNLIVIHDDLDLPLSKFKISCARSSAGHKGVESVIKKIKTNEFVRLRVGISPASTAKRGEPKKKPEPKELVKFLLGKFTPKELPIFKKTSKKITSALEMIITEGLEKAMSLYN